jgi:hypothetical protein
VPAGDRKVATVIMRVQLRGKPHLMQIGKTLNLIGALPC